MPSTPSPAPPGSPGLTWGSRSARVTLAATITASGMAFLDGSVVNVALPRIGADLGGDFATLQWIMDGYLLTLGSLVLVGGALGDLLGKRRVFLAGLVGFGLTSLACGLAPTSGALIAARALQGATAALLVPGSLAILSAAFVAADRGRAIGLWSGLSGVFTALGPFAGGALVDATAAGWRWVFLLNAPLAVAAVVLTRRGVPALPGTRAPGPLLRQVDVLGGLLVAIGLGLLVAPLIEAGRLPAAAFWGLLGAGILTLLAFVALQRHRGRTLAPPPMLPLGLFAVRSFSVANAVTLVVYGALTAALLLLTVVLQAGLGWSALAAGAAGLPITVVLAALSSRVGALVPRIGARPLLTAGPILMAAGLVLLSFLGPGATYLRDVLPGLLVFALGLALVVAPITTTALGDVGPDRAGVASGVNNAVARVAGLVAIAALPFAAGLTSLQGGPDLLAAYARAQLLAAALCASGGLLAWAGFSRHTGRIP